MDYVDQATASSLNLTYSSASSAVLRVDSSASGSAASGRKSARVTSKTQYDRGLFIFDVVHSPFGCATWPALWLADPDNWPDNGEVDIMEAVNRADTGNQMTLHTGVGCTMADHRREMSGTALDANCDVAANANAGCGVRGANASTYGAGLNAGGGGVTAVEWRSAGIRVWQFARGSIPGDIRNNTPDPTTWGSASADFPNTGCDIDKHFRNQSIIINISLCGDWAGGSAYTQSECESLARCPSEHSHSNLYHKKLNRRTNPVFLPSAWQRPYQLYKICRGESFQLHSGILGIWCFPGVPVFMRALSCHLPDKLGVLYRHVRHKMAEGSIRRVYMASPATRAARSAVCHFLGRRSMVWWSALCRTMMLS